MPRWALPRDGEPAEESSEEEESEAEDAAEVSDAEPEDEEPDEAPAEAEQPAAEAAPSSAKKKTFKLQKPSERGTAGTGKELGCHVCGRKGHNAGFVGALYVDCPNRCATSLLAADLRSGTLLAASCMLLTCCTQQRAPYLL